jgi:signal transduction histidine kinase
LESVDRSPEPQHLLSWKSDVISQTINSPGEAREGEPQGKSLTRTRAKKSRQQSPGYLESQVAEYLVALQVIEARLQMAVHERERTEAALHASQRRLRALATGLQELQEEERRRIARDIHDELAQAFTSLKIDASWLSKRLVPGQEELQVCLSGMTKQIDMLFDAVERIGTALRPHILDHLGLLAAIEWQLQDARRRTGLSYTLTLPHQEVHIEPARATALFRIFQEAFTNVLRHAEATHMDVHVAQCAGGIRVEVSDNGKGMRTDQLVDHNTPGLLGMRERAQLWDGDVTICNRPTGGTTVTVFIPDEQAKEAESDDSDSRCR